MFSTVYEKGRCCDVLTYAATNTVYCILFVIYFFCIDVVCYVNTFFFILVEYRFAIHLSVLHIVF